MKTHVYTLVNLRVAYVGYRFIFHKSPACDTCRYKNVCISRLKDGRIYEIVEVKKPSVSIICPLTNEEMYLARVTLAPIRVLLPITISIEGSTLIWRRDKCSISNCLWYRYCFPKGLKRGDLIYVKKVFKDYIKCPINLRLMLAEVIPQI